MNIEAIAGARNCAGPAVRCDECGDRRDATPTGPQIYFRGAPEVEDPPAGSSAWGAFDGFWPEVYMNGGGHATGFARPYGVTRPATLLTCDLFALSTTYLSVPTLG